MNRVTSVSYTHLDVYKRQVLKEVQEYISSKYSTLMVEGGNDEVKQQVKRYISKYIADYRITVKGKTREELICYVL